MPSVNQVLPIQLQLWDKAENKFVTATVRLPNGQKMAGSPVSLAHVSEGYYNSTTVLMPEVEYVTVFYEVYNDSAHTTKSSDHSEAFEIFVASQASGGGTVVGSCGDQLVAEVVDSTVG